MADEPMIDATTLDRLLAEGDRRWESCRPHLGAAYHGFVPGDHRAACHMLARARPEADSFLELGSGVGVITILAALMGYDAVGIEVDPQFVRHAEELATAFAADASFVAGSFIPAEFQERVDRIGEYDSDVPVILDGAPAYDELGRDLADFDLVHAFHWPGTEELFLELIRRHGRRGALLSTYGGMDGYRLWRDGDLVWP